jgi:prepilin-type N-terminal cleavage/methylation domain-containing protein
MLNRPSHRRQGGFTLVELMIALVVSLIVIGAAINLTVNISQAATNSAIYARTSQDARTLMNVVTRELKRAGFNVNALNRIGQGTAAPAHTRVEHNATGTPAVGDCILFGYDTLDTVDAAGFPADTTPGVISIAEPGEWRGFRRTVVNGVGILQVRTGGSGVGEGCGSANHTWANLTQPNSLDVLAFQVDVSNFAEGVAGVVPDPANPALSRVSLVGIRPVLVTLRVRSPQDPTSVRELRQWVRMRAEGVRLVPMPGPTPPPTGT